MDIPKEYTIPDTFVYNDSHYNDFGDFIEELDLDEEQIKNLPEDYSVSVEETKAEPLFDFTPEWILENIDEERTTEEGEELERLKKTLTDNIDFKKINELMPEVYYPTGWKYKVTKSDLINYIS